MMNEVLVGFKADPGGTVFGSAHIYELQAPLPPIPGRYAVVDVGARACIAA